MKKTDFLKIIITVIVIILIFQQVGINEVVNTLAGMNLLLVIIAVLLSQIPHLLIPILRWREILNKLNEKISTKELTKYAIIGYTFSLITPSKAGDFLRAWYLKKEKVPLWKGITSILLDRASEIIMLSIISAVGLVFITDLPLIIQILPVIIVTAFIILLNERITRKIISPFKNLLKKLTKKESFEEMYETIIAFIKDKKEIIKILLITSTEFIIFFVQIKIVFLATGLEVPIIYIMAFTSISALSTLIPITLSGYGVREGVAIFLFSSIGIPASTTLAVYLIGVFISQTITAIPGVIAYLTTKQKPKEINP